MQKNNLIITTKTHILSKNQAKFNKLVAEIQKGKDEKAVLMEQIKAIQEKVMKTIMPLAQENKAKLIEMLFNVDAAYDSFKMTKKEKEAISRFIYDNLDDVINSEVGEGKDATRLKALYEKHTGDNFDDEQKEQKENMADMFEQVFGFRPEEGQKFDEDFLREQASGFFGNRPPREKKKSKKQLEAEAKEKEAENKMKKDARGIYTQLAKLLHPDMEQDETLKLVKEELMKRVTNAYSANDLYELLQIQLEVEQMDNEALAKVDDGLMDSYIKVLQKQMSELRDEIYSIKSSNPFLSQYLTPAGKISDAKIRKSANEMKESLEFFRQVELNCVNQITFKSFAKDLINEFEEEDNFSPFSFNW
jgi:hypothetical protein